MKEYKNKIREIINKFEIIDVTLLYFILNLSTIFISLVSLYLFIFNSEIANSNYKNKLLEKLFNKETRSLTSKNDYFELYESNNIYVIKSKNKFHSIAFVNFNSSKDFNYYRSKIDRIFSKKVIEDKYNKAFLCSYYGFCYVRTIFNNNLLKINKTRYLKSNKFNFIYYNSKFHRIKNE